MEFLHYLDICFCCPEQGRVGVSTMPNAVEAVSPGDSEECRFVKDNEFKGHKQAPKAIKVMLPPLLDGMQRRTSRRKPFGGNLKLFFVALRPGDARRFRPASAV